MVPTAFDFRAPHPGDAAEATRFLGAWGPGIWTGGVADILTVDEVLSADWVRLTLMWGQCCTSNFRYGPGFAYLLGTIVGGKLSFKTGQKSFEFEMTNDGKLHGTAIENGNASQIYMPRLQ
jgi:hypothetical protein